MTKETAVTTNVPSKAEKAARLAKLGYYPAGKATKCCLCKGSIAPGQFIGKMPASWNPNSARRHAHYSCVDQLREQVRQRAAALGIVVPAGSVAHG